MPRNIAWKVVVPVLFSPRRPILIQTLGVKNLRLGGRMILKRRLFIATFLVVAIALTPSAYAIPAPDIIVGSVSSISQLLALLSVALGGAAFAGSRLRATELHTRPQGGRLVRGMFAGAIVLLLGSVALNVYQWLDRIDERDAHLRATLSRPAMERGKRIVDPSMRELTYKQQTEHSLGISTDEVAALLHAKREGGASDVFFLDIRENVETEMGRVDGFNTIRFPDFWAAVKRNKLDLKNKLIIVFCHNGNRSHETAEDLVARGLRAKFMVGGFQKWFVEGRPIIGLAARTPETLRAIARYPSDKKLLDLAEVKRLIEKENAIFVDVRYRLEYEDRHLPEAINIPIRKTASPELHAMIKALPHRPIIIPCYDRRGCFFGRILGYELHRAGFDFRGRFTHPYDYFEMKPLAQRLPHVAKWRALAERSIWDRAVVNLSEAIYWFSGKFGTIIGALFLLALVARLLVLPFSVKAERDQIAMRVLADEVAALKARLKDDPRRLGRAMGALYRRHRITPARNLLVLAFLPLFIISIAAIELAAGLSPENFLWVPDLSAPDPFFALPVIFAALICLYIQLAVMMARRQRLLVWVLGGPLMAAAMLTLSAAASLYAVFAALLVLLQQRLVAFVLTKPYRARRRVRSESLGVVPLAEAHLVAGTGNKAARLGQLVEAGFTVPRGLVLTARVFEGDGSGSCLTPERRAAIDRLWPPSATTRVAVRSSGASEDGHERSFAGIFETVLNIDCRDLAEAVRTVRASFASRQAASYAGRPDSGGVIVQEMIEAEYAGVLFTQHPSAGGLALVEMVAGNGEQLVSGAVTPMSYRFGRYSGRLNGDMEPPIDLQPLLDVGRRAEELFDTPQDIEWVYRHGRFYLLQSRHITGSLASDTGRSSESERIEAERSRLLRLVRGATPDQVALAQDELSELVPRPTPLTLSFLEAMWKPGGTVDLACRKLGVPYVVDEDAPPYLVTVFGGLYVNALEKRRRARPMPSFAAFRLGRMAAAIEAGFTEHFLPEFLNDVRLMEAVDLDRLSIAELVGHFETMRHRFITRTYVQAEIVNIAASFYLDRAKSALESRGLSPAIYLSDIPETVTSRAVAALGQFAEPKKRLASFLDTFGHRAQLDYELACPRYREDPKVAEFIMNNLCAAGRDRAATALNTPDIRNWRDKSLATLVTRARRFEALKEDAKHYCLRELALLHRALTAIDHRLSMDGDIFYLTPGEVFRLAEREFRNEARALAQRRQADHELFQRLPAIPAELSVARTERMTVDEEGPTAEAADGPLKGTLVAGSEAVIGPARVISAPDAENGVGLDQLEDGEIVVSRLIHPRWSAYFPRARGLICEVGGWLSHVAILAREYNVPMIVGVRGVDSIRTGELLKLYPDGSIERIGEGQGPTMPGPRIINYARPRPQI